jgi:xylan 1,4-beta-xylosidase
MKIPFLILFTCFSFFCLSQEKVVDIEVDANKEIGELKPIWAWYGYDEPNYTYMKNGKKLLGELADMSPVPVYIRTHNLMTTGNGTPSLKWGSTNMYTEDKHGNPVYNWQIVDSIFDTYIHLKMKPLAEIGFMPEALSSRPEPYKHNWNPADSNSILFSGWAYPPKDYNKWAELIYQWVKHCIKRYGKTEVESWYWELWNEPNIGYLQDENQIKAYSKMYDYASDAVKRALPKAKMGGPHMAGFDNSFFRSFINHCLSGLNEATGKTGTPLDFIAFHAKGSPIVVEGIVQMGIQNQLNTINDAFKTIASIPEIKHLPIIIGESDPEGCAACGMNTHPANAYRNGTIYSSYTAASLARIYDLNSYYGTNLTGAVNWSFEFENQPWFYGFRDLATNGVDKPVLNVFRMFGMMPAKRIEATGNFDYDFNSICDSGIRGERTDINALASKDKKSIAILLWNYHDKDIQDNGSAVNLTIKNVSAKKAVLYHYRIDNKHSNSYEAWKKMGSPQNPTKKQIAELEKSGQLEMIDEPKQLKIINNQCRIEMQLPRQAVSLVKLQYKKN